MTRKEGTLAQQAAPARLRARRYATACCVKLASPIKRTGQTCFGHPLHGCQQSHFKCAFPVFYTQRAPRGLSGPLRSSRGNLQPVLLRSNVVDLLGRGNRAVGRSSRCRSRSRDGPGGCVSAPRPACSATLLDGKRVSRACDMLARKRSDLQNWSPPSQRAAAPRKP